MAQRTLAKTSSGSGARGPSLSGPERIEAWVLTGPAGRVYSFGRDFASAVPMLARYWAGRLRDRRGPLARR